MGSIFSNPLLRGYPVSYKLHTYICLFLGAIMALRPSLLLTNPIWIQLHLLFGLSYVPPSRGSVLGSTVTTMEAQQWSNVGILITAIGLINMAAASAPGWSQFARVMPELRLVAALLTGMVWAVRPESRDLVKALIVVEDGIGGLITGWQMGLWG
jgi:uncharacterized protein (DUF983 family)